MRDRPARSHVSFVIRTAGDGDIAAMQGIERLAGERFRDVDMPEVADGELPSQDELRRYVHDGRCWVAADESGRPIGYVVVDEIDGNAHVEQVSVGPDHQGTGVGRALMDRARSWATSRGMPAVTLTTFRDVPWNGPLYRHLGFGIMNEVEIGPELRALRDAETAHGLDPSKRVCMRLDVVDLD